MKSEKRIREEIERLKREIDTSGVFLVRNASCKAKIEALEWVLDPCEPLDDFYFVEEKHFLSDADRHIWKGLDNARKYFEYEKKYLNNGDEIWIYPALIDSSTGSIFPDYKNSIDYYDTFTDE